MTEFEIQRENSAEIYQRLNSHGQDYLVGNTWSKDDIHLVELWHHVGETPPQSPASLC